MLAIDERNSVVLLDDELATKVAVAGSRPAAPVTRKGERRSSAG
jgi:hypothetical protein